MDDDAVMSSEECWDALEKQEFGRLAYVLGDEVDLVPLNYAVDRSTGEPTLLFRTSEGSKLLGILLHPEVVFEIDHYDETSAQSVIVRGRARRLEEDEEHRAEVLPLRPWVAEPRYVVVELVPQKVSGRHFVLERPWLHARVDV